MNLTKYQRDAKSKFNAGALLTKGSTNTKTGKNKEVTYLMTLSPARANSTGKSTCSNYTDACESICLYDAGLAAVYGSIKAARINKTEYFFNDRLTFLNHLQMDIESKAINHGKKGEKVVMRLNTMSDLDFLSMLKHRNKFDYTKHSNVTFYDYTASINKLKRYINDPQVVQTFSRKEDNWNECVEALELGPNVSVVFEDGNFPEYYKGYKVVNGDITDTEMLRYKGVILALKSKGRKAKLDQSGFVVRRNESGQWPHNTASKEVNNLIDQLNN